jgi:hypothetical protein
VLQGVITTNGMMTIPFSGAKSSYAIKLNQIEVLQIKTGLHGRLSFATSGFFEGGLWGTFNFADGLLKISADKDAVVYHLGTDGWFEHIGTEELPVSIKLLKILDANGYYMLGTDISGFKAGVSVDARISTCDCDCNEKEDANCARVGGVVKADILGSYNPIKFDLTGNINIGIGGCVDLKLYSGCKSARTGVDMWMGISPTKLGFSTDFSPPCVDFRLGLNALPNPSPILDLDWTCGF